nr:MAG TPA: hypothetical protein [Caudoviricetes sp.]
MDTYSVINLMNDSKNRRDLIRNNKLRLLLSTIINIT